MARRLGHRIFFAIGTDIGQPVRAFSLGRSFMSRSLAAALSAVDTAPAGGLSRPRSVIGMGLAFPQAELCVVGASAARCRGLVWEDSTAPTHAMMPQQIKQRLPCKTCKVAILRRSLRTR
jgi:hypothetical protein